MSSARFPWRLTLLMIMCLFGSVIYYDIFTHGSFESKCSTLPFFLHQLAELGNAFLCILMW